MTNDTDTILKNSFCGFTLAATLKNSGVYVTLFNKEEFLKFPEEITTHGNTFTLETIDYGNIDINGDRMVWANYG